MYFPQAEDRLSAVMSADVWDPITALEALNFARDHGALILTHTLLSTLYTITVREALNIARECDTFYCLPQRES